MALKDIKFSDLYLEEDKAWLSGVPGTLDPMLAPPDTADELKELRKGCEKELDSSGRDEFTITCSSIRYRASVLRSMTVTVFVLRRFPDSIPELSNLGFHQAFVTQLMEKGLTGLIVVAGAFGQGKTTTASALVASRVGKYGGIAVCIEDPPEMPLEGHHGEGVIYQRWVHQGGFAQECRQAARWAPSIIFVGEVRDPETATEALRASINGRLVICTIHSESARTAIDRLYVLANGVAGSSDDVASLLSNGLRGVVHQSLVGEPRRAKLDWLWVGGDQEIAIRNLIRSRKFEQLDSQIQLQRNQVFLQNRAPIGAVGRA